MAENLKKDGKDEKKKGGMSPDLKWIALGLGFALTTVGATFLGVHFYVSRFMLAKSQMDAQAVAAMHKHKARMPGPTVPILTSQIVNLKGGRFLKFSVSFQFLADEALWPTGGGGSHGAKAVNPLEKFEAFFKDTAIETIAGYSAEELKTDAGRIGLRKKLKDNINQGLKRMYPPPPDPHAAPHTPPEPEKKPAAEEEPPAEEAGGGGGDAAADPHAPKPLPEVMNVFFTEFVVS
ncbi:MAG: flagellar basal body-associated FliL family protein [Candidatus Sericytochromatia bacterium]|nr:flagellar basal body-associated FliL family protein [Candidatus Sericytochromatia bacterium]